MDAIRTYLTTVRRMPLPAAERTLKKLGRHPDIARELEGWIGSGQYPMENAVSAEGYTARDIAEMAPFLDGVGAYNFLISLREQPERARETIAAGFPRK